MAPVYDRVIIKAANSFDGEPLRATTMCRGLKIPNFWLFKTREWKKTTKGEMGRWTAIGFLGQCVHWNFAMSAPKSVDCPLHSLTRHNLSILTARSCPFARENTRTHDNFPRRFFYPLALRLAACIPRIIRILQLSHRTILSNKRYVVITSGTPISSLL